MKLNISMALGINPKRVGVKVTTNEQLGFLGRKEGIAALAVADDIAAVAGMPKAEISWKRRDADGLKHQVYAQHVGEQWFLYARGQRFEQWQRLEQPPLEDWLELLDAVRRRISRRRLRPEEELRVMKVIRERFPGTEL